MTNSLRARTSPQLPSIREAAAQIRAGTRTASGLVEHCLARIGQFEERVHAWVIVDEAGARREAERLDELANRKQFAGPLHGIPVAIKDLIDVAGWPTKAASPLRANSANAERDAPIVAQLRAAGAIILGKTVTTEWACFDPPPSRNPWNLAHTPGGSSSGSAAAVALEMCLAALGTQTGGSIIRPAAYCGICGLKPTFSALDMGGILPVSARLDHVGPMARTAEDVASVYAAITGKSLGQSVPTPRFAVLQSFVEEASDEVRAAFERTIDLLASASARIEPASGWPANLNELRDHHWRIMAVDAANVHRAAFEKSPELFGPKITSLIESGLATKREDYALSLGHQQAFRAQAESAVCENQSFLLMPATPTPAPDVQTTGDPRFNFLWSYCGLPAVTIPCGLSAGGLPIGLQLVGPPNSEPELLAAAAWCEHQIARSDKLPACPLLQ